MELLEKSKLRIVEKSMTPVEALHEVGNFLHEVGSTHKSYTEEMIDSFHTLGPYFVIAPSIALAHSKPSSSVIQNDLVLVLCKQPVNFGSKNDPVTLLFGLCAKEAHGHMDVLMKVGEMLEDQDLVSELSECETIEQLYNCIHQKTT